MTSPRRTRLPLATLLVSALLLLASPAVAAEAEDDAPKGSYANLEYRLGDIEDPPIDDKSVDLAILSQALHHAADPAKALREAHRILKPKGRLIILDLLQHSFEKRERIGSAQVRDVLPNPKRHHQGGMARHPWALVVRSLAAISASLATCTPTLATAPDHAGQDELFHRSPLLRIEDRLRTM